MTARDEEFLYFGEPDERMLGVLHAPSAANDRQAGWLLCPAYGEEQHHAGRTMVEWARLLSDSGFWVFRFDCRGSGDSAGRSELFTFDDNLADVRTALREMERRAGVRCCGLCGLRLGATLAVAAALEERRDLKLVLWDPIVSGEQYAQELLRLAMTTMMVRTGSVSLTRTQLRAHLTAGGRAVVQGHVVNEAVYTSLERVNLLERGRPGNSPILIVQIANQLQGRARPPLEALRQCYAAGGPTEMTRVCLEELPWLLPRKRYVVRPPELFEPTRQWITAQAPDHAANSPHSRAGNDKDAGNGERMLFNGLLTERPVAFPIDGKRAWGILLAPQNPDATKPIVILPSMSRPREVKLARGLGQHGWTSLRFDPRGMGNSEGDLEFDLWTRLDSAFQNGLLRLDVEAAVDFVERELGTQRTIVIGNCRDAIAAVCQGATDKRIVGIVPMELPVWYIGQVPERVVSHFRQFVEKTPFLGRVLAFPKVRQRFRAWRWRWLKPAHSLKHTPRPGHSKHLESIARELGGPVNVTSVTALIQCAERGVRLLCVFGELSKSPWHGFERIMPALRRVCESRAEQIAFHVVEGADHIFSLPEHTAQLLELIVRWLDDPQQPWANDPATGKVLTEFA